MQEIECAQFFMYTHTALLIENKSAFNIEDSIIDIPVADENMDDLVYMVECVNRTQSKRNQLGISVIKQEKHCNNYVNWNKIIIWILIFLNLLLICNAYRNKRK